MSELMDDEGENRAVRAFLVGRELGFKSVEDMRDHMQLSGLDNHWPEWVAQQSGHLSKSGAQDWLRHLFSIEPNPLKEQNALLTVQVQDLRDVLEETSEVLADLGWHKDRGLLQTVNEALTALPQQVKSEDASSPQPSMTERRTDEQNRG